jgi:hypothetical protein
MFISRHYINVTKLFSMQLGDSSALTRIHTYNSVINGEGQKLRAQFRYLIGTSRTT